MHNKGAFKLEGAHLAQPCFACHLQNNKWIFAKMDTQCSSCHQDIHQGLLDKKMQEKDYWANLQWMPDGKELWDHIKQYKPTLLSAPSRDPQSRWGKRIWVKKNIPGTPLILAAASAKKNYARKNAILIDDRISNINDWNDAGGIGILHTSTATTLEKLSKYGL